MSRQDEVGVLEFFKYKKVIAHQVPLLFKVRVKKGEEIVFMKYQELKRNYPQILIGFFQKKMLITATNLPIKNRVPHEEAQIRLNSMIESYEDTLQGLNLLQNGQLRNNSSIDPPSNHKRKKEEQNEESISGTKKFRGQKQSVSELDDQRQISNKKKEKVSLKQMKNKVNYDEILKKKVGQNYKLFYFPAYLSLFNLKNAEVQQRIQKKECQPIKKSPVKKTPVKISPIKISPVKISPIKKKQSKKPNNKSQPDSETDSDSLDLNYTDSQDQQTKSKNKKKFR